MRLTAAVCIGGRLGLLIGFASLNLVFGSTLNYFYGYTNPNFGTYQATDAFSTQTVSYVSQVSMVTMSTALSTTANLTYNASSNTYTYSTLGSAYGYSAPATQSASSQASNGWSDVNTAQTSAYTPQSSSTGQSTYTPMGTYATTSSFPASNYQFVNGTGWNFTNTTSSSSAGSGWADISSPSSGQTGTGASGIGWAAIDMSVTPKVSSVISNNPVVGTPSPLPPSTNLGDPGIQLAVPEPSTVLSVSGGLGLLLLGFYRRRRA